MFNRVTKIHEREFEVLPKSWELLHEAMVALARFTATYRECPDFNRMTQEQLDKLLEDSFLHNYEKEKLKKRLNEHRLSYYQKREFYHKMNEVRRKISEFHSYTQKNAIFLSRDLKDKFKNR